MTVFAEMAAALLRLSDYTSYDEGAIPFPDPTDRPGRTVLTGEGGATPSRFKHIIQVRDGKYRRLTPVELERLNGFPDGWTNTGLSVQKRAFLMGNALVVGIVERIGRELAKTAESSITASHPKVVET